MNINVLHPQRGIHPERPVLYVENEVHTSEQCRCSFAFQVCAEHEEKNEKGETRRRLYVRQYRLPKGVDVERLKPSLSKDGVLSIEAPAPGLAPSERLLPIQYQSDN